MLQELSTKTNIAQIGEEIGMDLGTQMVKSYQEANPTDVKSYTIGRDIIEKILAQPGCAGIKFFNAMNEGRRKNPCLFGVDSEGKPLLNTPLSMQTASLKRQEPSLQTELRLMMVVEVVGIGLSGCLTNAFLTFA
jgi:hypothetical protein